MALTVQGPFLFWHSFAIEEKGRLDQFFFFSSLWSEEIRAREFYALRDRWTWFSTRHTVLRGNRSFDWFRNVFFFYSQGTIEFNKELYKTYGPVFA